MKKLISLVLCLSLLAAMLPALSVSAEQGTELQTLYDVNFENGTVGAKPPMGSPTWVISSIAENTEKGCYVRIGEEEDGNKVLHLYRVKGSSEDAGIRGACSANLTGYETLYMRFKVKSVGAGYKISMHTNDGSETLYSGSATEWKNVQIDFDFKAGTYTVTTDTSTSPKTLDVSDLSSVVFRFGKGSMPEETGVYYDDIVIGTYDTHISIRKSPIALNQEVYWEYVLPENPISETSYVKNTVAHPRVLVTDWAAMREKVNASEETQKWYANIKATADAALTSTPQKYVDDNGHLKLYAARNARDRLQALAFVYNIEQDEAYANKAYEEMLYYGEYKNWSGFGQTLVCAEILFGFACAYDWLYYTMDDAQKAEIIEIMKAQALGAYVYHYEGMMSWSFSTISINWNPVCNAALMMAAMAIADEEPEKAEYFMEMAPPSITRALAPYAPEGAYPEGVSYWDYGTSYLIFANHLLETAFKPGFEVDEAYKLWKAPGIAETCDFGIYMNGPAGRFDYGDCVAGNTSCEVMYWAAERFNKPYYAWWQNNIQKETNKYLSGYPAIMSLVWYNPENVSFKEGDFTLDKFYSAETSKLNGFTARSSWDNETALFTAMQGGINKGSHLHQSLGTYIIDYMGKRFIDQEGGANYDLANEEASNVIYGHRAESNNCLVINPTADYDQKYGARAQLVSHRSDADTACGILDMTNVYSNLTNASGEALVPAAQRGLMLTDNRSRVLVRDEVTLTEASTLYWFAHTPATVTLAEDGKSAVLDIDGTKMLARIVEAPAEAKFEMMDKVSVVEEGVIDNITDGKQKLAIHLENQTGNVAIAVEYVPLVGESVPEIGANLPLADWVDYKTETTVAETENNLVFTTKVTAPKSGYLAVVLYGENGKQIGMKLQTCSGMDVVTSTFAKQEYSSVKVMLIENFLNMRILTEPEVL